MYKKLNIVKLHRLHCKHVPTLKFSLKWLLFCFCFCVCFFCSLHFNQFLNITIITVFYLQPKFCTIALDFKIRFISFMNACLKCLLKTRPVNLLKNCWKCKFCFTSLYRCDNGLTRTSCSRHTRSSADGASTWPLINAQSALEQLLLFIVYRLKRINLFRQCPGKGVRSAWQQQSVNTWCRVQSVLQNKRIKTSLHRLFSKKE